MAKALVLPFMLRRKMESGGLHKSVRLKMELFLSNPDQEEGGEAVAGGAVQQDAALPGQGAVGGQVGGREVNLFPHGCTADV